MRGSAIIIRAFPIIVHLDYMYCHAVVCVSFTHCPFALLYSCREALSCFSYISGSTLTGDAVYHTFDFVLLMLSFDFHDSLSYGRLRLEHSFDVQR